MKKSLFIVIEGLDGSGKSSASRKMTELLDAQFQNQIKLTFEPHDASCGGVYIRQVLMKKITTFQPRVLALAFAANRLDHCSREIEPILNSEKPNLILCDRYYLSSLVYQSSADFPFEKVMEINEKAIKPDIIFFLNVSNEVCYQRMQIRNQPKELFEDNLEQTREKYRNAIAFLKTENQDNIIEIDGSGTIAEVANSMLAEIQKHQAYWTIGETETESETESETELFDFDAFLRFYKNVFQDNPIDGSLAKARLQMVFENLENDALEILFLELLKSKNLFINKQLPSTQTVYELNCELPLNININGAALFLKNKQQYDVILSTMLELQKMASFLIIFTPDDASIATKYYESDKVTNADGSQQLFPAVQFINKENLVDFVLGLVYEKV
jgi:dTMP kinase